MTSDKNNDEKMLHPETGRFGQIVKRVEETLFTVMAVGMIIIGLLPIVLRYSGSVGVSWAEPLSRHMVLWIALLGAGTAIKERSSISVDVISHLLSIRNRILLRSATEFISAVTCGVLAWVSISFVRMTLEFESETVAFLGIREWWLTLVLPCGFFLLGLRLLIAFQEDLRNVFKYKTQTTVISEES